LALLHLDGVILEDADPEVFFVDFDGEAVPDVLDGKVLPYRTELTDDLIVRGVLLVLSLEVVECFS
jgi:hypothetical protein